MLKDASGSKSSFPSIYSQQFSTFLKDFFFVAVHCCMLGAMTYLE